MVLWNQAHYFEKRDAGYVYRPTALAQGFSISEREKDLLYRELRRLERRFFIEGGLLIALTAGVFMTSLIEVAAPIAWFMFCSVVGVTLLAATAVYRRDRLVGRVLGHRDPDVARLPFRQALAAPRPSINKRHAIMVLQSMAVLFALALIVGDALVFYVIFIASGSLAIGEIVPGSIGHAGLWAAAAVFNVVLIAGMVFAMRQARHLRLNETRDSNRTA